MDGWMDGDDGGGKIYERGFFKEIFCVTVEVGCVIDDDDNDLDFIGGHTGLKAHLRYSAEIREVGDVY